MFSLEKIYLFVHSSMINPFYKRDARLRYKPEGRWFDSRFCHRNFSIDIFRPHYGHGVIPASNRIEYQEYFLGGKGGLCVVLTTLPYTDYLEIWEPQPPGAWRTYLGLYRDFPTFTLPYTSISNLKMTSYILQCVYVQILYLSFRASQVYNI